MTQADVRFGFHVEMYSIDTLLRKVNGHAKIGKHTEK